MGGSTLSVPCTASASASAHIDDRDEVFALVERARTGDRMAFDALVARYRAPVRRFAMGRMRCPDDADDVAAETMVAMWRQLPNYRWTGAPFGAWVFAIARRQSALAIRRRVRAHEIAESAALDVAAAPPKRCELETAEQRHALIDALDALNDRQRRVIAMRFFGDMSTDEVAQALGERPTTVRQLQLRALERLRLAARRSPTMRHAIALSMIAVLALGSTAALARTDTWVGRSIRSAADHVPVIRRLTTPTGHVRTVRDRSPSGIVAPPRATTADANAGSWLSALDRIAAIPLSVATVDAAGDFSGGVPATDSVDESPATAEETDVDGLGESAIEPQADAADEEPDASNDWVDPEPVTEEPEPTDGAPPSETWEQTSEPVIEEPTASTSTDPTATEPEQPAVTAQDPGTDATATSATESSPA